MGQRVANVACRRPPHLGGTKGVFGTYVGHRRRRPRVLTLGTHLATPEPASSPSKTVATALAKPTTRRWIAVYVTSSLFLLSLEVVRIWSQNEDTRLNFFIKSRRVADCMHMCHCL